MKENFENREGFFNKVKNAYQAKADSIAANRDKLTGLLHRVSEKIKEIAQNPAVKESIGQFEVAVRMIKAHVTNEYKGVSNRTLGMLVLGLLYFVLPLDFLPDFIPVIGYVDDLTVIVAIFKSLSSDIEKFLEWERTKM
jgi:uncharacterized membrane protein YkvA (DUF1232 family)